MRSQCAVLLFLSGDEYLVIIKYDDVKHYTIAIANHLLLATQVDDYYFCLIHVLHSDMLTSQRVGI